MTLHRKARPALRLAIIGVAALSSLPASAASRADYDKAYAAAVAAEADAGKIKNQWTSTQDALEAAQKAAAAGDYAEGERKADLARAMAQQSSRQGAEQKDAWRSAVIGADEPSAQSDKAAR